MQGASGEKGVIRLGDLLAESGYVRQDEIERAMEFSKKNMMALGRVLVVQKLCTDEDVRDALEIQKLCKLDGMSNGVALRVLKLRREERLPLTEVLRMFGWIKDQAFFEDPAPIRERKDKLRVLTSSLGTDSRQVAELHAEIGDFYNLEQMPARAESAYSKALEGFTRGSSDKECAAVYTKVSRQHMLLKEYKLARVVQDKAKELLEKAEATETVEYGQLLFEMGELAEAQRRSMEAEQNFSRCLSVRLKLMDIEDPRMTETIKRVVKLCKQRPADAVESVSVGDLLVGARLVIKSQIAEALKSGKEKGLPLGRALVAMGFIDDAQLQMALQIQVLIRNHEMTSVIGQAAIKLAVEKRKSLDQALDQLGCRTNDESLSKELLTASDTLLELERELTNSDPRLACACGRVALLYFEKQRWTEAEQLFVRGMSILNRANPESFDEAVADFVERYAALKLAQQDLDEASRLFRMAVAIRIQCDGKSSAAIAENLRNLGLTACTKGDHQQGVLWFSKALTMKEKFVKDDRSGLLPVLEGSGDCYLHCLDYTRATSCLRRALTILEDSGRKEDPAALRIADKLIHSCREMGDRYSAEQLENQYGRGSRGLII